MNYSITTENEIIHLLISGDVDLYGVYSLQNELREVFKNNPSDLNIDIAAVSYIDSAGIGMLIGAKKMVETNGKTFKILNMPTEIEELFKTLSIFHILQENIDGHH